MTTTTYIIAWAIYLSAAIIISAILWKLSESWRQDLKSIFRASLIVILFTPYFSDPQQYKLTPAFLICFFEFVFGDKNIAISAATPLTFLLLLSIGISIAINAFRKKAY